MDQVTEFFAKFFEHTDWPPRWHCGKWSEFHGWLYIISDLLIWSAYFTLPLVIIKYISRKKDTEFVKLYFLFAAFILACGATHFLDAVSFWFPFYRIDALVRLLTGVISWVTVFFIVRYLPVAFSMRSQKKMEEEIEQRKKIESELRDSENQVQTLFANAPEAIVVINSTGIIRKWNPAAENMFGWKAEEVIGKGLNEFIVPQGYWDVHAGAMENFLKTGAGIVLNKPIVQPALRKDGPPIEVEFIVSPVKINGEFLLIGFLRDVTEVRKSIDALRESEERYRLLTSEVHDYAIIMLSPEGNITSWNEGAHRITGYTEEEVEGKHFSIFYSNETTDRIVPMEELGITSKEGRLETEGWRVKKDGSLFLANVVLTALTHKGKIIGYSQISRDITTRKKAEEEIIILNTKLEKRVAERTQELQQSETKYRKLFQNSPMPMWVLELPTLRFLDVNEAAIVQYGYSRQEFLSMTALDIRSEEENLRFLNFDRLVSMGMLNSGNWKHIKKDGSIVYAEVSSHELHFDNKPARLVLSMDVTERKKAEERLDIALEAGQIGIWELDMITDTSVRNSRYDQILGYEEISGTWGMKNFLAQVFHEDEQKVSMAFADAIQSNALYIECRIILPDETLRWIIATGKFVYDNRQHPVKMLGTVTDINDLKLAEESIRVLNNELEQRVQHRTRELDFANKELESFSYSVSHDLRAPLRAIHGYSQLLNENYKAQLDEEGKRMLGRVMLNTKKMSQLIDDLLEFSRLGKASLKKDNIDLDLIVQDVLNEVTPTGNLQYKVTVHKLGTAFGDKVIIQQVFQNLLLNAFKYSSKKENPEIEIGVKETIEGTTYFIKDNGAGFDMAYYDKLFGVFQRMHRQDEFEGTGVGLAIVQKIVSRHGGRVWAEAKVNEGATFYFTLTNSLP
ncbi:MAG: PAS domain S-box protein [Ferruginibacter sp.]